MRTFHSPLLAQAESVWVFAWDCWRGVVGAVAGAGILGLAISVQSAPGELRWRLPVGSEYAGHPALGPDGTIYVGTLASSVLSAVNPEGTMRWTFDLGSVGAAHAAWDPVVGADGTVYATTYDGHLVAVGSDGVLRWHRQFPHSFWVPAALGSDGTIYVSLQRPPFHPELSDTLAALNPDGSVIWQVATGEATPIIAHDGTILMANRWGQLLGLNPDGTERWREATWSEYTRAALGVSGVLYTGSANSLRAYGPEGGELWSVPVDAYVSTSVVLSGEGRLFAITNEQRLWCLTTGGEVRWTLMLPEYTASTPAVSAGGLLYFGCGGNLYALTLAGATAWVRGAEGALTTSPVIASDGTIYIGGNDGYLYAIEGDGTGPATQAWPMHGGDARRSSSRQGPVLPPGTPANAQASDDAHTEKVTVTWTSAPHARTYEVWRHTANDLGGARRIVAGYGGATTYDDLSAVPGTVHYYWVRGINRAGTGDFSSPDTGRRKVAGVGEVVWRFPTRPPSLIAPAVGVDGRKFLPSGDRGLVVYSADGSELWKFEGSATAFLAGSPVVDNTGNVLLGLNDRVWPSQVNVGRLICLAPDGGERWRAEFDTPLSGSPAVAVDGTMLVPTADEPTSARPESAGLYALEPDGNRRWFHPIPLGVHGSPTAQSDGTAFCSGRDGYFRALKPDGTRRWRVVLGSPWGSSPVLAGDGLIYVSSGTELLALNQDGTRAWAFADPHGHGHNPVLADDGTLFFGASNSRLIALRADGLPRWEQPYWVETAAVAADNSVHFSSGTGLQVVSLQSAWLGQYSITARPLTPVVIASDRVAYFGADDGYVYGIRTTGGPGASSWPLLHGDPQNRRRSAQLLPVPARPAALTASQGTLVTGVQLDWVPVRWAQSYEIWRSATDDFADPALIVSGVSGTNTFQDRAVPPEVPYFYCIRAANSAGVSEFSGLAQGLRAQPQPGDVLDIWEFDGAGVGSPALGADGTVYVPVYRGTPAWPQWRLAALKTDGSIAWEFETGSGRITATPAVGDDGTIYFGSVDFQSDRLLFHAVSPDGTERWNYDTGAWVTAGAAITKEGRLIVPGHDGSLHALDRDGSLVWKTVLDHAIYCAPSIGQDGAIYVVARQPWGSGPATVNALNPDGTRRWTVTIANHGNTDLRDSPAIGADGAIHVGGSNGRLLALNLDGTVRWNILAGSGAHGCPLLDDAGAVYSGASDNQFFTLNSGGEVRWSFAVDGPIWGGGALGVDGMVYLASADGRVHALKPDGEPAWTFATSEEIWSSPLLTPNGGLYVVSTAGNVYSFHASAGAVPAADWPLVRRDGGRQGRRDGALPSLEVPADPSASFGTFNNRIELSWSSAVGAWFYEVWRGESADWGEASRIVTGLSGTTHFVDHEVETGESYFYWVAAGNDAGVTTPVGPVEGMRRAAGPGELVDVYASADPSLGADGFVITRTGELLVLERNRNQLVALNPNLSVKWRQPVTNLVSGLIAVDLTGRIFTVAAGGHLDCFDRDGNRLWRFTTNGISLRQPAVRADGVIIVPADNASLIALNPDGTRRWETPLPDQLVPDAGPAITVDGTVVVPCIGGRLVAVAEDGSARWTNRMGVIAGTVIGSDGMVYQRGGAQGLAGVDVDNGVTRWNLTEFGSGTGPIVVGPDNSLVAARSDGRVVVRRSDGSSALWSVGTRFTGQSAVAANGDLYLTGAAQDGFLYAVRGTDGALLWKLDSTQVSGGMRLGFGAVLIGNHGMVYVQVGNNLIAAVAAAGGRTDAYWPTRRGDGQGNGQALRLLQPPQVEVAAPLLERMNLPLYSEAIFHVGVPRRVEYWSGTAPIGASTNLAEGVIWSDAPAGRHRLRIEVEDDLGERFVSRETILTVAGPALTAAIAADGLHLEFPSHTNSHYFVLSSGDLEAWRTNSPALEGTGAVVTWQEPWPTGPEPRRFFRLEVLPRP